MAQDLQQSLERLDTNSPQPPDSLSSRTKLRENGENGETGGQEGVSGEGDEREDRVEAQQQLGQSTAKEKMLHQLEYDDIPTPPINVPIPATDHGDGRHFNAGMHHSRRYEESSTDDYISSKRTSIAFDPTVKLDSGDCTLLEAPLPKINTGARGRSLLDKEADHSRSSEFSRPRSETDREQYDPETGERLYEHNLSRRRDNRFVADQSRWPFLQTTVNEIAANGSHDDFEQTVSLTSRTTASTIPEEALTPSSAPLGASPGAQNLLSPISIPSPVSRPDWFFPRSLDSTQRIASRSKSYGLERKATRRTPRRSSTISNSMSPASAFLSKYMPTSALPPDPDAEGEEVGEYVMGREIGFGGFSIIREAHTFVDGKRIQRAVKIVRKNLYGKEELENESLQAEFEHEVELWRCLSHKHILPLIAVYISDFATFAFTQLNTGGTLFDAVRNQRNGLPPQFARRYAYQLASAMRYLHEDMRIVHRDIKLENCLLDMTAPDAQATGGKLLLCDFGLADYMSGEVQQETQHPGTGNDPRAPGMPSHTFGPSATSTSLAGSLPYAAPELLEAGKGILSPRGDIWSYGVVCFAMVAGKLPFSHSFAPRVRVQIISGEWDRDILVERELDAKNAAAKSLNGLEEKFAPVGEFDGMIDLIDGCLERNPRLRADIRWVLDSNWLEEERDADEELRGWAS